MIGSMVLKSFEQSPDLQIPAPAVNPYIQSRAQPGAKSADRRVPFWRVMGHLLAARREAVSSVKGFVVARDKTWLAV